MAKKIASSMAKFHSFDAKEASRPAGEYMDLLVAYAHRQVSDFSPFFDRFLVNKHACAFRSTRSCN